MAIPKLKVTLDSAQPRISRDRIATLITAKDWDKRYLSNAYIDPITNTAMLCPAPRLLAWDTTGTGIYTRFRKGDYNLTSARWQEANHSFNGDVYLLGAYETGNPAEAVRTTSNMPRNGGIFLKWYAANNSSEDWVQMECGWSATPSDAASSVISLRCRSGGSIEVWEYGVLKGTYNISGDGKIPQNSASTFTDLVMIPFRKRELLVFSNRGGGFSHIIESINDTDDDPTILPSIPFWWYVAPPSAVYVQCAPIKYPTSGYVAGVKTWLQYPPETGEVVKHVVYGDTNGGSAVASLVSPTNIATAFTPNGVDTECRVKVTLQGNSVTSPNVYAAHAYYNAITENTNATQSVELLDYITSASLEVGESPDAVSFRMELKKPQEINDLGGIDRVLRNQSNRPINICFDSQPTQQLIDGQTEAPSFVKKLDDGADRLSLEVRDRWKAFEQYSFTDPVPLDGLNISDAFTLLCTTAGFTESDLEIDVIDFVLPSVQNPADGEFSALIEVGDTVADWILRLQESYYPTLFIGWVPKSTGIKFVIQEPSNFNTVASVELFTTVAAAKAYLTSQSADTNLFPRYLVRSYSEHILEPEANDIWVTGRDVRTGRPIQCHKADIDSQDPTLLPSVRPDNWLGEIRKYAYYEPFITTQGALEQATNQMYDKLTPIRVIIEFEADMLFKGDGSPIWRNDPVWINGYGGFRITSLSTDFRREPSEDNDWWWRPTRYTAEQSIFIEAPVGEVLARTP